MNDKTAESFMRPDLDQSPYADNAFHIARLAQQDRAAFGDQVIDATIGSLFGEDGRLAVLDSVYGIFDRLDDRRKAAYAAGIAGNDDFCQSVFDWINRQGQLDGLPHGVIATPGGTGAIGMAIATTLTPGQTLLIPDPAWGSYAIMAKQNQLDCQRYALFDADGRFAMQPLMDQCRGIMERQHRLTIVINDPCQNPTGLSLGPDCWQRLMDFFNQLGRLGPVVIIDDIAYIDYSHDPQAAVGYMRSFSRMSPAVAVIIAFSCSKALTAYGMRLGAAVMLAQDPQAVEIFMGVGQRFARACWSNVNNGMMDCFVELARHHKTEYMAEKSRYIDMLAQRSQVFLQLASQQGLPCYHYDEGFFITLALPDREKTAALHRQLMAQHVFTLNMGTGIRVAICSLPVAQCRRIVPIITRCYKEL